MKAKTNSTVCQALFGAAIRAHKNFTAATDAGLLQSAARWEGDYTDACDAMEELYGRRYRECAEAEISKQTEGA